MSIFGFNFRASNAGGFLDIEDANQTYSLLPSEPAYPITRNGITFGRVAGSSFDARDRNASLDPRLAGLAFNANPVAIATFRVDLPAPGTWQIRLALGDAADGQTIFLKLQDDTTDFAAFDTSTSAANRWRDATNVERTEVTWPTSNVQLTPSHEFTSTILYVVFGDGVSKLGMLAHLELESGSAEPVSLPRRGRALALILD